MKENILIVEDEFIVANDLRLKLTKRGYNICGIAPSVDEAKKMIDQCRPTWVLLDIYLQDGSLGTDIAPLLTEKNIGFIYISANTNQSVLESAKATQPYGFLVKPFREKDLVIMLDIARQKHQHNLSLFLQRELIWKRQLDIITDSGTEITTKIGQFPGSFQPFMPFDLMRIYLKKRRDDRAESYNFVRTGFDEYQYLDSNDLDQVIFSDAIEFGRTKISQSPQRSNAYLNDISFKRSLLEDVWEKRLCSFYDLASRLNFEIKIDGWEAAFITFYSKKPDGYSENQLQLIQRMERPLARLLTRLRPPAADTSARVKPKEDDELPALLKQHETGTSKFEGIIGKSPALVGVLDQIEIVAASVTSVLITGESGTGKEKVAQCIHQLSTRKNKSLVIVNCAALSVDLIESELFGHEKGAFTGAFEKRIGKFEQADGSTIFLDEIGELPLSAQVKLLRVLQEMEFERVGSSKTTKVDVRVLAATNRNLEKEVSEGRFRLDLYYRLNVFPISLPPLRERIDDVVLLTHSFIEKFSRKMGRRITGISIQALNELKSYDWPGNVRELEHTIERSILDTAGSEITAIRLPKTRINVTLADLPARPAYKLKTLDENEADHILEVLKTVQGKVAGPGGAAEILGLPAGTLYSKMKKLGIKREFDSAS